MAGRELACASGNGAMAGAGERDAGVRIGNAMRRAVRDGRAASRVMRAGTQGGLGGTWYGRVEVDCWRAVALSRLIHLDGPGQMRGLAAADLAASLLAEMGDRLAHSRMVAEQTRRARRLVDERWRGVLGDSAWLHDVGYTPAAVDTGFHPLDGARWLRREGWPDELCRLVAWHSRALTEARLRGLAEQLVQEFEQPPGSPLAVLTWADLTSSPDGRRCTVASRLNGILRRYPPESVVHRAIVEATAELLEAVSEVESALADGEARRLR